MSWTRGHASSTHVHELHRPVFLYIAHAELRACVGALRGKWGARLNAHTELRAKRQRSAREVIFWNRPIEPFDVASTGTISRAMKRDDRIIHYLTSPGPASSSHLNPVSFHSSSLRSLNGNSSVGQGLTLVHLSAQLERFLWDRRCA